MDPLINFLKTIATVGWKQGFVYFGTGTALLAISKSGFVKEGAFPLLLVGGFWIIAVGGAVVLIACGLEAAFSKGAAIYNMASERRFRRMAKILR